MVKTPPAKAGDIRDAGSIPGWKVPRRRAWQPTLVFLPGEPHGQRSLASMESHRVGLDQSDLAQHRPGSSLLHAGFSLVAASGGSSPVAVLGFLMWWLLMLQSTASGAHGLQQPWLPGLAAPGVWDLPGAGIKPVSPREALKYVLYESSRSLRLSILCSLVSPLMYFK